MDKIKVKHVFTGALPYTTYVTNKFTLTIEQLERSCMLSDANVLIGIGFPVDTQVYHFTTESAK